MKILSLINVVATLLAAPAWASGFDNGNVVASSTLESTVAHSSVNFYSPVTSGDNIIANDAFKDSTGVITIAQNTGANAVVQQAVSVSIGSLSINTIQ